MTLDNWNINKIVEAPPPVLTGLALEIEKQINFLKHIQDVAMELESGLPTQTSIRETSVELRAKLLVISRRLHDVFTSVLPVREDLLANIGAVQTALKKEALMKEIADKQAMLDKL